MNTDDCMVLLRDLWFRYRGGSWILRGVNLCVRRGESILVVGGTGSGKTTLARVLNGVAKWVYGGEFKGYAVVDGLRVDETEPWLLAKRIHVVGQNPYMYFIDPLVRQDLEAYAYSLYGSRELACRAVRKAVESMNISGLLDKYFFELSGGQARRALVAKSMIAGPEVIVFDEPLMWLDDNGVNEFLKLVESLRFMGKTLIFMEHRFIQLLTIVDRVLILRNGVLVDETMEAHMLKHRAKSSLSRTVNIDGAHTVERSDPVVLKAEDIWFNTNGVELLKGVHLVAREGDYMYIYGGNGSGKTTLLRILAGYLKPVKGKVWRRGAAIYVPQNIHLFYTEESVAREIENMCKAVGDRAACLEKGKRVLEELGIDPLLPPFNLSHGQMVKLAVSLAGLRDDVDLVLLDEPFSGLTYTDRVELAESLARLGKTILIAVSSRDMLGYPAGSRTYRLENGVLQEYNQGASPATMYADIAGKLLGGRE